MNKPSLINIAFLRLIKRAENRENKKLIETFVDVGNLYTIVSGVDNQVIYGRRGTGKTHLLKYLAQMKQESRDLAVYLDLRTVGSNRGIYTNGSEPLAQRASRLLIDTISDIHSHILDYCVNNSSEVNLEQSGPALDKLATAITGIRVIGTTEVSRSESAEKEDSSTTEIGGGLGTKGPSLKAGASDGTRETAKVMQTVQQSGTLEHTLQFGTISNAFTEIMHVLNKKQVWILIDEWSSIPYDLQPFLADFFRRCVFPIRGISVKIAAIEHRSRFMTKKEDGDYIGIELGADASANVDLDDFMVYDKDIQASIHFFKSLLFKHFKAIDDIVFTSPPKDEDDLISQAFTQVKAFEEFVRAVEGVPRDAINLLGIAAQKALDKQISIQHIRTAAANWYEQDKESSISENEDISHLLLWIINEVIGHRLARAFLLKRKDASNILINQLFDARLLHILKRNVSSRDEPGIRYVVYKLDYGCYVDLISTIKEPRELLPSEKQGAGDKTGDVNVPADDYRAIRRAILDLDEFMEHRRKQKPPT